MSQKTSTSTVDPDEIARFAKLAETWWDPKGPMKPLHKFNPLRIQYLRDAICTHFNRDVKSAQPLDGLRIIDIGCGAGMLSEPLARLGATVVGIDPAEKNVFIARAHAEGNGVTVSYVAETIEDVVARGETFDIVLAMEVVEHVADVPTFMKSCCTAVKPGGLLFMATLNRTMRSFALAIVGAEYVLRWLPRGTHQWEKFVTPDELTSAIKANGVDIKEVRGVVYNPLRDQWSLSNDTAVNYLVTAVKPSN
ncbi:bifunctional 2-polyprenyl-6-hydroxyphenol methylase/3-demethylubiquinol 3-O-methyltransferase UbiG [Microvirga sp. W0021]|uniref:Ubiquinone biosynthesis O-methyltransferase n=1 Tax=Hohaiivirga grylli TaxID=3133970 RepID=A0ABV0BL82_9HYPH